MTTAFIFPGQGSQAVGMGRDLAGAFGCARLLFEEIDDALDQHLSRIMFEGPDDDLRLTENAQPALMATSMAIVRVLREEGGVEIGDAAAFVAGHSLGEYTALAAAGSIGLIDTARLLKLRGQSMQKAVPVGEGGGQRPQVVRQAAFVGQGDDAGGEAVHPGQHRGIGRSRRDVGGVVVLEQHALAGEPVDVRRRLSVVAVAAHVVGAQAVDTEEDEVERFSGH